MGYGDLYKEYHRIINDIQDQKERTTHHKSIKAELEEMRKLLNIRRMSYTEPPPQKQKSISKSSSSSSSSKEEMAKPSKSKSKESTNSPQNNSDKFDSVDINFQKKGGTIMAYVGFSSQDDATKLHKAIKGFGTDESTIIGILGNRCLKQRREINRAYNQMYGQSGKTLDKAITGDTSGYFRNGLLTLLKNFGTIDALSMQSSIKKKDINQIVLTLGTRTSSQVREMIEAYNHLYNASLFDNLKQAFNHPQDHELIVLFA